MLVATLLAASLLGQAPPPPPADPELRLFVEYCVPHPLSAREASLLRGLGHPRGGIRRTAEEGVEGLGVDACRLLADGLKDRDVQVRSTCERLVRELFRCGHCLGTGRCPDRQVSNPSNCPRCGWSYNCVACGGTGGRRS